jgi:GAF domain-containing protein
MSVSSYVHQELTRLREENQTLREEVASLRRYATAIEVLADAIQDLNPDVELFTLLDTFLYNAQLLIQAEEGLLLVLDEDTNELVFVLHRSASSPGLAGARMPADKGIAGWVMLHGESTVVNLSRADDRMFAPGGSAVALSGASVLAAPLAGCGRILGVVELFDRQDGLPFKETDRLLLSLLCRYAGDLLESLIEDDEQIEAL